MAVKDKKQAKIRSASLTPKQQTAVSAKKWGIPFWALWGIAGAESTWGRGGSNLFGLTDAAEGVNVSNWKDASEQSAKTLAGLKKQYGNLSQAIAHYSGYSYNASHPKELAASAGVTPTNENKVIKRELSHVKVTTTGGQTENVNLLNPEEDLEGLTELGQKILPLPSEIGPGTGTEGHPRTGLKEGEEVEKKVGEAASSIIPSGITNAFGDFDAVAKLIVSPQFWIRVAEAIGGMILLYMALKALTGASVPGEGAARTAAKAAAFKRLPPRQRVK